MTPGPWQTNCSHLYGADPERPLIAQFLNWPDHGTADMALSAAAPDMLDALEWIAANYENGHMSHVDFRVGAKHRADAAIAKARP